MPRIHTHALLANKVRAKDGTWLAIDGGELFAHQKAGGMLYKAALRAELSSSLGVTWGPVDRNGIAEIEGIPEGLVEHWSKRRREVDELGRGLVAEREIALGRAISASERAECFQFAAYRTRAPKLEGTETTEALRSHWRDEARAWGFAPEQFIDAVLGRQLATVQPDEELIRAEIVRAATARLADGVATFGRADVIEVLTTLVDGASAREVRRRVEELATEVLENHEVLRLSAPLPGEPPASLLRNDGMAAVERHGGARFTTRATLLAEAAVLDAANRGVRAGVAMVTAREADSVLAASRLGSDQAAAIRAVVTEGDRIALLVGPAGAGKSTAVGVARAIYEQSGYRVIGLAPSAMAAEVLQAEAGIASETLAKFLLDRERGDARALLGRNDVVILDEASMVRTDDLARLVRAIEEVGSKLVLSGDAHQLGAVGPGGLFRTLVEDHGAAELETVRRFEHAWERSASLRLRAGDSAILPTYLRHDRIEGGSRAEMLEAVFVEWLCARDDGRQVVVMAGDNATVDEIARRCRAVRVEVGEVERGGIETAHGTLGIGDEVMTLQNDRKLVTDAGSFVRNGNQWTITARDPDGALMLSGRDGQGSVRVPPEYASEQVALAYALTVHKAQGATSTVAILVVDSSMTAEQLYVGMTRGRESNRAFVVLDNQGDGHTAPLDPSPVELLAAVMAKTASDRSAHDVMRAELGRFDNRQLLADLISESRRYVDEQAGPDRTAEIDALGARVDLEGAEARLETAESAARLAGERRDAADAIVESDRHALRSRLPGRLGAEARLEREHDIAEARDASAQERTTWGELSAARHNLDDQRSLGGELENLVLLGEHRHAWITEHPDERLWVDQLTDRIATREHAAHAAMRERTREVLASQTDRDLVIEARGVRDEIRLAHSDIARLESDIERRQETIERIGGVGGTSAVLVSGNAQARVRVEELRSRVAEIEPRLEDAITELERRGMSEEVLNRQPKRSSPLLRAEEPSADMGGPEPEMRPRGPEIGM